VTPLKGGMGEARKTVRTHPEGRASTVSEGWMHGMTAAVLRTHRNRNRCADFDPSLTPKSGKPDFGAMLSG